MTQRLYLEDSRLYACDALVTNCAPAEAGFLVMLDRSVFFPNKGGQPCDVGYIADARVLSCDEVMGELCHLCDRPVKVGEIVPTYIDEARRNDIMQQHTGEHLLSSCAYRLFDAANVGFHCALDYSTLDLDKPLSFEQVLEMEASANAIASENRPVYAKIYGSEEEIRDIPLRKHSEGLTAPIRLVTIEGADCCTCCAPHVAFTGEIGMLLIVDAIAYKGGMRLTFLCGKRAYEHARAMHDVVNSLARSFSASRSDVLTCVEKQRRSLSEANRTISKQAAKLDTYLADGLIKGAELIGKTRLIVSTLEDVDAKRLKPLALETLEGRCVTCLFSKANDQLAYVVALKDVKLDAGELVRAINPAVLGKGGGRATLAQGSSAINPTQDEAIEHIKDYLRKVVKAAK